MQFRLYTVQYIIVCFQKPELNTEVTGLNAHGLLHTDYVGSLYKHMLFNGFVCKMFFNKSLHIMDELNPERLI